MSTRLAPLLKISETVFAGGSYRPSLSSTTPQALEKSQTYAFYNGAIAEASSQDLRQQLKTLERIGLNVLDGAISHKPGKPTEFSDSLLLLAKSQGSGTNLGEEIYRLTKEKGCTQFKPYSVSNYLIKTKLATGEVYLPHELMIFEIYQRHVVRKGNWEGFRDELLKNVRDGILLWQKVDAIKEGILDGNLDEARKEAYKHVRLIGADKPAPLGFEDHYKLLQEDPKKFFEVITDTTLDFPDITTFDNHGTPISRLLDDIESILGGNPSLSVVSQGDNHLRVRSRQERHALLPGFTELLHKNIVLHGAAKNKYDVPILAAILERNKTGQGYVDIVDNMISKDDIYREIIKQRQNYVHEFQNDNKLYRESCKKFDIVALVKTKDGRYMKVSEFDTSGNPVFENDITGKVKLYTEPDLINELKTQYEQRIIHNVSSEAFRRKEAEIRGLFTGWDIEYNHKTHESTRETLRSGGRLNPSQIPYEDLALNDLSSTYIPPEASVKFRPNESELKDRGPLGNKTLQTLVGGKENLKSLIRNLPGIFNGLLRFSGFVMSIGGLARIVSPLLGNKKEGIYKLGYILSNGIRAVCSVGGALRGLANVNRYQNVTIGEIINFVAAAMPNGIKHMLFGIGNPLLFGGRGLQRAQAQQVGFGNGDNVAQTAAQEATRTSTRTFLNTRAKLIRSGMTPVLAESIATIVSTTVSGLKMIWDTVRNPSLIFKLVDRTSGISGKKYKSISSSGHLITLVGAISGLGAILAGTIGRMSRFGNILEEGSFNKLGRWLISVVSAVPAIGLITNAKEIMENPEGYSPTFKGLNGKEIQYNPRMAGLRQIVAASGLAATSLGNLANKYVAAIYDFFNGLYYLGVAEEEKINSFLLGKLFLGKGQELHKLAKVN